MREPATGINLYMQGCISKIAATAQNESWKPTSNNQDGRQSNIKKAAIRRVFSEKLVRPDNPAKVNRENITTDRTTEADSPVKKAKAQRDKRISKVRSKTTIRHRSGNHRRQKQSSKYRKPICKPDKAST